MVRSAWWCCVGLLSISLYVQAEEPAAPDLQAAAEQALSSDPAVAAQAVFDLRQAGPPGVAALWERWPEFRAAPDPLLALLQPGEPERFRAALDAVGAQRNCDTSRLYWYTDLAAAQAAAEQAGKPILSLRLLGKLTDELSCANSRYFRTALYANTTISDYLREHFILHWQSVRPVPRVTIDFGDGRKIERTLTGNSIHYVLDPQGRPFDALPGLYGPQAFLRNLQQIETAVRQSMTLPTTEQEAFRADYHRDRLQTLNQAWEQEIADLPMPAPQAPAVAQQKAPRVPADRAGNVAIPKRLLERPLLRALVINPTELFEPPAAESTLWEKLGHRHRADAILDQASLNLIRRQNPRATFASSTANPQQPQDTPLHRLVRNFQTAMAIDTVRNEYELHRQLHTWFAAGEVSDLDYLNGRIYAELFLTPDADPWLGLVAPDTYTGLEEPLTSE